MRFFSLFAGIGGFEKGIYGAAQEMVERRQVGQKRDCPDFAVGGADEKTSGRHGPADSPSPWQCVGYSETDKYAEAVYRFHWPDCKNFGDATKIDCRLLPEFDLLVAGFPCQDFSIAGKRQGFDNTRGTLFFEIARICQDKRPRYLLLENVKGLLSHDAGKTFQVILKILSDIGYILQWEVLNSKNFGVPQNRERVFLIGYLGKESQPKVLFIEDRDQPGDETAIRQAENFYSGAITRKNQSPQLQIDGGTTLIAGPLDANYAKGPSRKDGRTIIMDRNFKGEYMGSEDKLPSLRKGGNAGNSPIVFQAGHRTRGEIRCYDDCVPTITADYNESYSNIAFLKEHQNLRRLTPLECERLQGFPDNFTAQGLFESGQVKPLSDCQRYKMLGNAVTTNVVKHLILEIFGDA